MAFLRKVGSVALWVLASPDGRIPTCTSIVHSNPSSPPLSRPEAAALLNERVLPTRQYGYRIGLGSQGQGLGHQAKEPASSEIITALKGDDPRLFQTYGEFPLSSLDILLDQAWPHVQRQRTKREKPGGQNDRLTMVDLGSGCGRLAFYTALTRDNCDIHGIEVAGILHEEALRAQHELMNEGHLLPWGEGTSSSDSATSLLRFHHGLAQDLPHVLQQANLIFCYSTAFKGSRFSEAVSALLLADEWNVLLGTNCSPGCLVITTDKALDPESGWELLDRVAVENPEVCGSIGYIHRRI